MYKHNVFIDSFLLLFGYYLLFYVLMRIERKSNNNILDNNLISNYLGDFYLRVSTILTFAQ